MLGAELTDEQLGTALAAIYGRAGERKHNPGGMSDNELAIVEQYRTMVDEDRQAVRTIVRRLAGESA